MGENDKEMIRKAILEHYDEKVKKRKLEKIKKNKKRGGEDG